MKSHLYLKVTNTLTGRILYYRATKNVDNKWVFVSTEDSSLSYCGTFNSLLDLIKTSISTPPSHYILELIESEGYITCPQCKGTGKVIQE